MNDSVLVLANSCLSTMIYPYQIADKAVSKVGGIYTATMVGCMGPGKALNLSRLGFSVTLHTVIGDDQPGHFILKYLEENGIRVVCDRDDAGTNTHINVMDNDGNRHSIKIIVPTFDPQIDTVRLGELVAANKYSILNVNNYCRKAIPFIKEKNKEVWCDLGDYEINNPYFNDFEEAATHVTMSGIKLDNQEYVMEKMINDGKKLVVITNGKSGCIAMNSQYVKIRMPAISEYQVVDTNGAGDSFFSGMFYADKMGFDFEKSIKIATIVAGLTIQSVELYNRELSPSKIDSEYNRLFKDSI